MAAKPGATGKRAPGKRAAETRAGGSSRARRTRTGATPEASSRPPSVAPAERHQMIAVVAYLRAERRGFAPGGDLDDWLEAEQEVDALLRRSDPSEEVH